MTRSCWVPGLVSLLFSGLGSGRVNQLIVGGRESRSDRDHFPRGSHDS